MALNPYLKELVDNEKLGFEDVFDLYAALLVNHVREITNEMIADEGITEYIKRNCPTMTALTALAVDFGLVAVPEMIGDNLTGERRSNEHWLEYLIRRKVETYVEDTKSFQIKVI